MLSYIAGSSENGTGNDQSENEGSPSNVDTSSISIVSIPADELAEGVQTEINSGGQNRPKNANPGKKLGK